jgi:hypothetical protein
MLACFALGQRADSGKQVAICPLIVTGHRFQDFTVGHGNTLQIAGEMWQPTNE